MKRTLLISLILSVASVGALRAQTTGNAPRKWDAMTDMLMRRAAEVPATRSGAAGADSACKFIVKVDDAEAAADSIRLLGGEATVIGEHMLTARLKVNQIAPVAGIRNVRRIRSPHRLKPSMEKARTLTGADKVQAGTGLETPYTGKGVVVGVIDCSFQFNHVAFKDAGGNSRITHIWNRLKGDTSQPVTSTTDKYDGDTETGGHATHVTNIAAGSVIAGNAYSGMAPEADIMMMPSNLDLDEIAEGVKWISETAKSEGKPWVVNMSFGGQSGPHDGTTEYDVALSNLCGEGGIIAAAMGNEGDENIHAACDFKQENDTTYLFLSQLESGDIGYIELWNNTADGALHYKVAPCVYNTRLKKVTLLTQNTVNISGTSWHEVDENNNKENAGLYVDFSKLLSSGKYTNASYIRVGLRVINEKGTTGFHAWSGQDGTFEKTGNYGLNGDAAYLVSEGSASIPAAIAVASYNSSVSWVSAYDGASYTIASNPVYEAVSDFSSPGPSLGSEPRPTVAAPGCLVASAFSSYSDPLSGGMLDKTNAYIVGAVDSEGKAVTPYLTKAKVGTHFFYGMMQGTSMATPAVSGIIALWLQANPTLTPDQVKEIIRTTAQRDTYTGDAEWDAKRGYGKIDAYEGLKKALALAAAAGIEQTIDNASPVSISSSPSACRILFNNAEPSAAISLVRLDGTTADVRRLSGIVPGTESVLNLGDYAPGVYLVRIATAHAVVTRKVVVR